MFWEHISEQNISLSLHSLYSVGRHRKFKTKQQNTDLHHMLINDNDINNKGRKVFIIIEEMAFK